MVEAIRCTKAAVYYNPNKKSISAIKAETGCTHIINGYLFNTKFQPLGWTMINGKVFSSDPYSDWGFCLKGDVPVMDTTRTGTFLSGIPILKNGEKLERNLTADVARKAERTAVGWTADGLVVLWCNKTAMTREVLQDKMLELGCIDALMFDGGGSTQGIFPSGTVASSRKVPTLLLFWGSKVDNEPKGGLPMVEVVSYSLKEDGNKYLTKNFQAKEFRCKDGTDPIFIAKELPMVLQYIRMRVGKAVTINSAYRTPDHNEAEGGVPGSQHCYGTAADIVVKGYTPKQIAAIAREIMPDWGGVGVYSNFTHVDVRAEKADWNG